MAEAATDYSRGGMDIAEQRSTFQLVMGITRWGSLAVAALVLFLTLWFCTAAGFAGAAFSTGVVVGLGVLLLRERKAAAAH